MTGRLFTIGHKSNRLTKEAAEELEEMGEDTSDMIMSQSKMREMIMNATKVASNKYKGVDIQDEIGNYKSTFQILSEIGSIWDEIKQADLRTGDNRQNLLLEAMAGKNRANTLASVLMNNDILQSAYQDSKYNAAGKAAEELEKVNQGIEFHLTRLRNAWQELWANAANRDVVNMFIDLGTTILNIINEVGGLQSAFALLYGGTIIKGLMTADSWLVKFIQGLNNAKESSQGLSEVFKTIFSTGDSEKGSRLKGLAQIRKDKENRNKPITSESTSVPEVVQGASEVTTDMTEVAAKNIKAEASKNATQANMQEMTSEEALKKAQQENTIAETEETIAKTEGVSASQRAVQENIKEAESIKLTTEAIKEKAATEALQYQDENPQKYKGRKKRRMPQHDQKMVEAELIEYYQNIADTADEAAEASMDWTLAYVGGFDKIESSAEETTGIFSKISTGFGSMLGSMSSGLSSLGSSISSIFITLATNPMTWLVGIPAAIGLATTAIDYFAQREQALVDGAKEATTEWEQFESNLTNYEHQYTDLAKQLENQNLSEAETLNIKEQIFSLQKQITDEYGKSADGINLVNGSLDDQLEKLRQLRVESQAENYVHNAKEYDNSIEKMEKPQSYNQMTLTRSKDDEDYVKQLKDAVKDTAFVIESTEDGLSFKLHENAEASEEDLNVLQEALTKVQKQMGADWDGSMFEEFNSEVSEAIKTNDAFLTKYKESRNTGLEGKFFNLADTDDISMYFEYQQAQSDYNQALLAGDDKKIAETQEAWRKLQAQRDEYLNAPGTNNAQFKPLFDQYDKEINESFERAYEVRKQMETNENKTLVEQAFGDYKENRKVSKENQKAVLEASKAVLKEWKQASKNNKEIDMGSTAMQKLAKAAKDANIPISTIINSLQSTGGTSALQQSMEGTRITAEEMKTAFLEGNDAITNLASQFGIDFNSPDAEIDNFINKMAAMNGAIGDTTSQGKSSLDRFYEDTSAKIEQLSSLTATLQKGQSQTGLSFTKLTDEKGNEIASEVKTIVDAYKDLEGFDLGSLFEETATGVKLNYDAYRALAAEEEAEVKRQYKLERAALANQLATATGDKKAEIQKQITELDMLSSAYDGATSALQKYLNQQNASDYGDTYAMLRDTTIKRADELMGKGLVGTEEFRSIAQLFSFDSLATADADKVVDNYLAGYEKVKKFFTEDNFTGMKTFADELTTLDEKFGTFTKETIDGKDIYTFEASDDQIALLAEHYGVSVDLIESLFDQLRAMGFNLHLYRDGGFEDFEKLDKQIEDSQNALKELKDVANDPSLIPDDLFNFNAKDLNTPEELKQKIEDLQDIQTKLPVDSDEYKEAQKIIENLQAKLKELEEHDAYAPKVTTEGYDQANDLLGELQNKEETIRGMGALNIPYSIEDDGSIDKLIEQVNSFPPELQTYIMGQMDIMGFNPETDGDKIGEYIRQRLSTGEPVIIQATPEFTSENNPLEGFYDSGVEAKVGVTVDPASEEAAKQEVADTIGSAEPDVGVRTHLASSAEELEPLATLGFNGEADFQINLGANASEANEVIEETKEEATKETEMPLILKAENTAQEAADQAGVQQGVNTTTTETKVTNEETHTVATTDTAQLDVLNQKMQSVQAMGGSTISIGVAVSGIENIEAAEGNINRLIAKDKSKVTVSVNGNAAMFNKIYTQTNTALNTLAQKKTEPKITANNSNLKDKVSEAKNKLNSIDDKKVHITASNSGFGEITTWKRNTYDNLHDKEIKVTTHYSYTGDPKMGKDINGSAHVTGTTFVGGHAHANGTYRGKWGLPQDENGSLINEIGPELVVNSRTGQWQILNGGYPAFADFKKGDIINYSVRI